MQLVFKRKSISNAVIFGMAMASCVAIPEFMIETASASQSTGKRISVGDSIANQHSKTARADIAKAKDGQSPSVVLSYVQSLPQSQVAGAEVFLSTGLSNNPYANKSNRGAISSQIQTLISKGAARIIVAGVAEDYAPLPKKPPYNTQPTAKGAELNQFLSDIVAAASKTTSKTVISFTGKIPASFTYDAVHPDVKSGWYTGAAGWKGVSGGGGAAGAPTTESTPVVPNPQNSGMTDQQIQDYFRQHGRRPGLKDMVWPNDKFTRSGGRFGEVRSGENGPRPHTGIDLSGAGGGPMVAGDSGTVNHTSSDISKSAGNYISVQRDNGGTIPNLNHHYRYLHMKGAPTHRLGSKVNQGDVLGYEGNSGAGIKDVHLHLDYAVPKSEARDVFLNNNNTGRYTIYGVTSSTSGWKTGVYTDPTPYYGRDQLYTGGDSKYYEPWLGNSWRWQFNTLYGTNLPTMAGSKGPTKKLPQTTLDQLKQAYQDGARLTPDEMAAIRQSMVNAGIAADSAGYNIGGQWVSQRTLASFMTLDDGSDFATLPSETRKLNVTEQSPKEIIDTIGKSRYGNLEWNKAMQEVNSKGLMTEFLMMQSEENFIREHNARLKQRVESMLATLTSGKLVEYSKKIQAMQIAAEADVVPSMIDLQLEASGDEYVDGIPGNGFDPMANTPADNVVASNAGDGNPALKAVRAAQIAASRALPKSIGRCAQFVRIALQQAGYKFTSQTSAYMYHTNGTLEKAGFTKIGQGSLAGYTPQVGDIVVWHRTSSTPHGHIQIYIGNNKWASDFTWTFYPYRSQRTNFTIYRDLSAAPASSLQGGGTK